MDELDKKIFEEASKYLDRDKAKEILMEAMRRYLEGERGTDLSFSMKHGEAIIYLGGIDELDEVRQEIYESDWYKSYFDENGNLKE